MKMKETTDNKRFNYKNFPIAKAQAFNALATSELHIAHRPSPPNYQEASSDNVETKCYISIQSNALVYTLIARAAMAKMSRNLEFLNFQHKYF